MITLRRPDDWHVHFRDGAMLRAVLPQPDIEDRRIALLSSLLSGIGLPA